eukprot:gnl/TRDRNA2_/TRDRNA2_178416_c0_seq1.p1 gnl/TRDRNA2_/TRDRNA2_178416_c0~~gnl/TRDRNA2_/TRDRNA2_178416_c0_seq1.p1  ORF type:complete len:440 (+),score=72.86 gnl/TRDRNA2_/TRDRNA2_178416_c0_seq1:125-1444(+)
MYAAYALLNLCLVIAVSSTALPSRAEWHRPPRHVFGLEESEPGVFKMPLKRGTPPRHQRQGPVSFLQTSALSSSASAAGGPGATGAPPVDIYGQIRVGTPPELYTVAFDTGSGNLMLASDKCRDLGCLAHKAYSSSSSSTAKPLQLVAEDGKPDTVTLSVSTGHAKGAPVIDQICLGPDGSVCAETGLIELSSMTQEPWTNFPYDGILGIGMPASSMDKRFNFLGNLAEAGILKRNRFAVWLANEDEGEDSEITFGDFDPNRLGSEVLWLPVSSLDSGMWQVTMTDVTIDNKKQDICGTIGCQVTFDTGTSAIAGPSALIDAIVGQLGLDKIQDCHGYDKLPKLGFHFRMYILNLNPEDYVKKTGNGCYHQLLGIDVPAPKGPVVLLGDPFLKRYFTVYDRDSLKVGVAFANHAMKQVPAGTTPVTNAQLSRELMTLVT